MKSRFYNASVDLLAISFIIFSFTPHISSIVLVIVELF